MPSENISVCTPRSRLSLRSRQHRVGDGADAHLQGRAVLDEIGDVAAYLRCRGGGRALWQLGQRIVDRHAAVDLAQVDERAAPGAWHVGVDFRYHHAGGSPTAGLVTPTSTPIAAIAVAVGGDTEMSATSIGQVPLAEERGYLLERNTGVKSARPSCTAPREGSSR